ncbi:hypothetical protein PGT21_031246 [Puccinia graminis f. sp. tritici]|uniref:Phosphatidylglycerophosphatase GEP4, mitochondrial n=1 Tax=Puccinia graminis f. sp. tritici TaxID=56615 RepID=A0A5B0PB28_PUCGR|nr:hypothetical protein PGT21_031246 [Puccinia graminis f. sp. tritici]KAA1116795.1 hypothetical protein PGTUg99_020483 [Puccinia graminis f. sp. tritici]
MPNLNLTAIVASLRCLLSPSSLVPSLHVRDIRCVDWKELKRKGYIGVVIDKDNCITKPYHDQLVPELQHAWQSCLATFGNLGVLLVSNSAGTADDPALIQAESVARHLGVPVLVHATKKPGQQVVKAIEKYFTKDYRLVPVIYPSRRSSCGPPVSSRCHSNRTPLKLVVIGDRVTTDIILASRLRSHLQRNQSTPTSSSSTDSNPIFSVLTQKIWQKEKPGTRFMRWAENRALKLVMQSSTRSSTLIRGESSSPSSRLPNLIAFPKQLSTTFEQSLSSSSQAFSKAQQAKKHLQKKYDSISVRLKQISEQPLSTIIRSVLVNIQGMLANQLAKFLTGLGRRWIEFKITLQQHLTRILENLKTKALRALIQSANKLQLKLKPFNLFDPASLGFKTPLFIQNLSKWKQLK